jgi:hypothetical protein
MDLQRGVSYTVKATVTNLSTAGGNPVAADLAVLFVAMANVPGNPWSLMPQEMNTRHFEAGQTLEVNPRYPLSVPANIPSCSGVLVAYVYDPNNAYLATAQMPLRIS